MQAVTYMNWIAYWQNPRLIEGAPLSDFISTSVTINCRNILKS